MGRFPHGVEHPAAILPNDHGEAAARWRSIAEGNLRDAVDHGDVLAKRTDRANVDVDRGAGILLEEGGEHLADGLTTGGRLSGVEVDVFTGRAPVIGEGRRIMAMKCLLVALHHAGDAGNIWAGG